MQLRLEYMLFWVIAPTGLAIVAASDNTLTERAIFGLFFLLWVARMYLQFFKLYRPYIHTRLFSAVATLAVPVVSFLILWGLSVPGTLAHGKSFGGLYMFIMCAIAVVAANHFYRRHKDHALSVMLGE